jgi:hypothetical protein
MALEHEALAERITARRSRRSEESSRGFWNQSQLKPGGRRHGLLLNFAKATLEPKLSATAEKTAQADRWFRWVVLRLTHPTNASQR